MKDSPQLDSYANAWFYKVAYSWLFYNSERIVLGLSAGLNVIDFEVGLSGDLDLGLPGGETVTERGGAMAPVPVLGLRIAYRATKKLSLVAAGDFLTLDIGEWGGTFLDNYVLLDWRLSKHISIGGGLTFLNLDVSFSDEVLASYRQNYRGAIAFLGIHF